MSYSASASSAASSGPSKSGDIDGGTAWNIQGINFGTQYEAAATAGGGTASPGQSATVGGLPEWAVPVALVSVALIGLMVFLTKRR